MNNQIRVYAGLGWKEARQLVPLVVMLMGVTFLVLLLWNVAGAYTIHSLSWAGRYIAFLVPGLYSAGAGAIMVGQEKENRTLWWNVAMPIAPSSLIGCKLAVALAGWCVMWIASLVFLAIMPFGITVAAPLTTGSLFTWLTYSLFLLLAGFYTAWRFQNGFVSLLMLIPIALVPNLLSALVNEVLARRSGQLFYMDEKAVPAVLAVNVVMFALATWLAIRTAIRTLAPARALAPTHAGRYLSALSPYRCGRLNSAGGDEESFRMPFVALVWQSIHQNRLSWISLATMVAIGVGALAVLANKIIDHSETMLPWQYGFAVFTGACAVSWLGVSAFAGDGSSKHMRFLADRGVSRTLAWAACHASAVSLFSCLLVAYGLFTVLYPLRHIQYYSLSVVSMGTVALVMFVVYGVSQWVSQTLRIVAANFVLAPLLSFVTLLWFVFAATALRTSLSWLLLCAIVPYLATWLAMRWHMDDRGPLKMLLAGAVTFALILVMPLLPAGYTVLTFPRVSADRLAAIAAESEKLPLVQSSEPMMLVGDVDGDSVEPPQSREDVERYLSQLRRSPQELLAIGLSDADATKPLSLSGDILQMAINRASLAKLQYSDNRDDVVAKAFVSDWIRALTIIAKRLRCSHQWTDQEAADFVEIWLTQSLSEAPLAELREEAALKETIAMLVDSEARNQARRHAVLVRWRKLHDEAASFEIRASAVFKSDSLIPDMPPALRSYLADEASNQLTTLALDMLDAGAAGKSTELYRLGIHELTIGPSTDFEAGPYSKRIRVNNLEKVVELNQTIGHPANQWFADWEQIPSSWNGQTGKAQARSTDSSEIEHVAQQ